MSHSIGVYPGTFDPVHAGHVNFALQSIQTCGLDKVVFLPEPKPRSKPQATDIRQRVQALKDELATYPNLELFEPKSERYTIAETLPELSDAFQNTQFTLLMGSDVFKTLADWNDIEILLSGIHIAVGLRGDDNENDMIEYARMTEAKLGVEMNYKIIHVHDTRHISSSDIRAKIK